MANAAVSFPNASRSYDAVRDRIRFWGYDSAIEVAFFLEVSAIFRLSPKTKNVEAGILAAFDEAIERIHQVAAKAYTSQRRSFYVLSATDF
jgi:hypothetical protein